MASGEIDPQRHKFWLPVEFLKVYSDEEIWHFNRFTGLWEKEVRL